MRFDSQERLDAWRKTGAWPDIHDALFFLIAEEAQGSSFLDLCCSTGLLGQRIKTVFPGSTVIGVDIDEDAIRRGTEAGISVPRHVMSVTRVTLPLFTDLLRQNKTTVLVARRCLSEIFFADQSWAPEFFQAVAEAGVREVFAQGRQFTRKAVHPIPSITEEINLILSRKGDKGRLRVRRGECAYIRLEV